MTASDVVIVGGGVIGLSLAYALTRAGASATVLDRGELGRAASWAGAGMIAPPAQNPGDDPLVALRTLSALLYPEWSHDLQEETGIDNGYRRSGGLDVAVNPVEDRRLGAVARRWAGEGIAFERLEPEAFDRVEPALNPALAAAYFVPDRAQIRNPRHVRALAEAVARRGARLRPGTAALGFTTAGDRVTAVRTDAGDLPCGQVVVAAGPWSADLLAGLGIPIATPPIKGQIVLLATARPVLRRIVEHGKNYLVPRDDGRVLVGATEEEAGFDTRTTAVAVRDLIAHALRLCPVLAEAEVERAWAGLRPGSLDARPYIGPVPGLRNLLVATGHRRAGLQLSPGTAEVVADLVLGRPPRIPLDAFRIDRDAGPAADDVFRS